MMKKRLSIFLLSTILFVGCQDSRYLAEGNSIYLSIYRGGGFEMSKELIPEADAKTFENLEYENVNSILGKDKNHVYHENKIIDKCDPKTFEYLGNYFFRDKNSIYFFGFYNSPEDWLIDSINTKRFRIIKDYWATDGEYLLNGYRKLKLDDLNTFTPLNKNWGKTKTKIIYETKVLENVDYDSFEPIDLYSGKDKNGKIEITDIY